MKPNERGKEAGTWLTVTDGKMLGFTKNVQPNLQI